MLGVREENVEYRVCVCGYVCMLELGKFKCINLKIQIR